jgi:hypothetical protein
VRNMVKKQRPHSIYRLPVVTGWGPRIPGSRWRAYRTADSGDSTGGRRLTGACHLSDLLPRHRGYSPRPPVHPDRRGILIAGDVWILILGAIFLKTGEQCAWLSEELIWQINLELCFLPDSYGNMINTVQQNCRAIYHLQHCYMVLPQKGNRSCLKLGFKLMSVHC